ncbi:MAG TPA: hypothetical protein DE179_13535 [Oceanospirillaceae bacterium]|nr:hypothetical protein [Oceanospirillaceae bacterium]
MNSSFKAILPYTTGLALSLSVTTSHAEEYQYAAYLGLADNNSYSATANAVFAYYFKPVNQTLGPKTLAPLLNKSSSIRLDYDYTNLPAGDSRNNILSPSAELTWVFENNLYIEAFTMSESINYKNDDSTVATGNGLTAGYFLNDDSYIELGNYRETDNKDESFDNLYMTAGHLYRLEDESYIAVRATINDFINDDDGYNGNSYTLNTSYFPNHDFGIYGEITAVDFSSADDRTYAKVGANYFFDNSINVGIATRIQKEGDEWYNYQHIYLGKRF